MIWLQNYYPERLGLLLIVNAPAMFKGLWSIIKPWLEPRTQRKIHVISPASTQESLKQIIPIENLIQELGGSSTWTDPNVSHGPWCVRAHRGLEKICSSVSTATAVNEDSLV